MKTRGILPIALLTIFLVIFLTVPVLPIRGEDDSVYVKIFAESDYVVQLSVASTKPNQPPTTSYDPFGPNAEPLDSNAQPQWDWSRLSGFIVEDNREKWVLTAGHGFMNGDLNDIQKIIVYFRHGKKRPLEAKLAGYSKRLDTALVKFTDQLPLADIPAAPFGSSADLKVGQEVLSIGFPAPFDESQALTTGRIINLDTGINQGLDFPMAIIHSCPVNPGGSGSLLLNLKGEVVGVNVAFITPSPPIGQPKWHDMLSDKFSVAIPVDDIRQLLPLLKKGGEVKHAPISLKFNLSGYYHDVDLEGISVSPPLPREGLMITHAYGLAFKLGFKPGDIILACDGLTDLKLADLYRQLYLETDLTKHFYFELDRGGTKVNIDLPLSEPSELSKPP